MYHINCGTFAIVLDGLQIILRYKQAKILNKKIDWRNIHV